MSTAVATQTQLVTAADLLEMGDIGPCELVRGEIRPMSPVNVEHAWLENEIGRLLGNFVSKRRLGWVMVGEVGLFTEEDPDTVRGADVIFISRERVGRRPRQGFLRIAPELAVEVVSPNDRWAELHDKIEEYFAMGIDRVWVVEPKRQQIRVYSSPVSMTVVSRNEVLRGEGVLADFALPVSDLFSE
ncbi:MAG: Uma2 family endonuclease [Chloroflexi bacterium]|nr:Uma2 family endonuclease [Chloroflexota bacterium]